MKNSVLVTGVNGFVGHHVAKQLHEQGIPILGVGIQPVLPETLEGTVDSYISCDLTDPEKVKKIKLSGVSAIINLAGFAKAGNSKGQGKLYNKVNVGVHTVLYEECLKQSAYPRIIAISSGTVYDPNQSLPLTEESTLVSDEKANEYIISKKMMEKEVSVFNTRGLRCIIVRPFNHSGPGQLSGFLLPDLGEQLGEAVASKKTLMVGNLKTKRDYTDVRDVARAYVSLATCDELQLKYNLYNICSGRSVSGTEILQELADAYGATDLTTTIDPSRIRPNEIMDIYGSRDRLTSDIGWQPKIPIHKMIQDYVIWQKLQK